MDHFQDFLSMVIGQSDQKFALATVIRVEGSAYRHEGAKLLVSESGKLFGIISGGCLEEDVRYRALALMSSGISEVASYDLRSEDDLGWGQGAGCNGKIDVLIEPFYWSNQKGFTSEKLLFLKEKLDEGKKIGLLRWVSGPDHLKDQVIFFSEQGETDGSNRWPPITKEIISSFMKKGCAAQFIEVKEIKSSCFLEWLEPKDPLYIFGAGADVEPLVEMASQVGFSITVIDPRSERCSKKYFPKADRLMVQHPETFLDTHHLPPQSYVVIMTHQFNRDKLILNRLIGNPLKYLGILGPRNRTKRLLADSSHLQWIHSPIGLDIGAEGPGEISVSILAQLIETRRRGSGQNRIKRAASGQMTLV